MPRKRVDKFFFWDVPDFFAHGELQLRDSGGFTPHFHHQKNEFQKSEFHDTIAKKNCKHNLSTTAQTHNRDKVYESFVVLCLCTL